MSDSVRPMHVHLAPLFHAAIEDGVRDAERLTDTLLRDATRERATDVHLDPGSGDALIRFRIDSTLYDVCGLPSDTSVRIVRHLRTVAGMSTEAFFDTEDARTRHTLDSRPVDLRIGFAPTIAGPKAAIRVLDPQRTRRRFDELGLSEPDHERLRTWLTNSSGAFVVAGPSGSGKTTTLYSILTELCASPCSIVTIEDPVEMQLDGICQIEVNEERGLTLSEGLKGMLRLDPDYLLLSEVRDASSAQVALEAASSGRALMTTLHARNAIATISALRNYGLEDFEISSTLEVVVAQRLVRRLCPACRREAGVADAQRKWLAEFGLDAPARAWEAVGCTECRSLGYQGRLGIFEVWRLGEDDYQAILEHTDEHALRRLVAQRGHRTLLHDALDKVEAGETSMAELMAIMAPPYRHSGV